MRSLIFNVVYGVLSIFYTIWAAISALRPGRGAVRRVKRLVRVGVRAMFRRFSESNVSALP